MELYKIGLLITAVLVMASVVAGCAPFKQVLGQDEVALVGGSIARTAWTLMEIGDEPVSGKPRATLTFAEDQVNGVAFCNSYFGAYTREGNEIEFGTLVQTEKFCVEPEGVMSREQDFLQALAAAVSYTVDESGLTFFDDEGRMLLSFAPQND